ncbi:hypothetical protein EV363DRAFT_1176271, partial [Boletus edulis]
GGGARYPYPKHVWSPAGGWWTRPANWASNTAIAMTGILVIAYGVWSVNAEREVMKCFFGVTAFGTHGYMGTDPARSSDRPIPSMLV